LIRLTVESNSLGVHRPFSASRKRESTSFSVLPVTRWCQESSPTFTEFM